MDSNILRIFKELYSMPRETEWVEFKEARNNFDFNELGKYFSAISNAANLNNQPAGWLVFGVSDDFPRRVTGTSYRAQAPGLEKLKKQIADRTNHRMTFRNIYELHVDGRRVLLFEIPPASQGIPTTWDGIAYGRIHDSLTPLPLDGIERIRRRMLYEDWSAYTCPNASLSELDEAALEFARQQYLTKHPHLASEVSTWDQLTFLQKTRLCISGELTRAALILVGKPETVTYLQPATARISWILHNESGSPIDYIHYGPPFLLNVTEVFKRIRNTTYRYLVNTRLFPAEITKYDSWVLREVLNNAIAHQDYTRGGHINVVEESDALTVTNLGDFIPGSVEAVIRTDAPPEFYRNRLLCEAMVEFNMIDTIGSGIKRMFQKQRERFFPLPDYDLSTTGRVVVRIPGKVLDERYTQLLIERTDLDIWEVIALDKVQKRKPLTDEEMRRLRQKGLIEGRRPNLVVSAHVAAATDTKGEYIRRRGLDKNYYKRMVEEFLTQFQPASREDIEELLFEKLPDVLTPDRKRNFIGNLLQEMRRERKIQPVAGKRGRGAKWELCTKHKSS